MSRLPRADSSPNPRSPGYPDPGLPLKGEKPAELPNRIWIVGHSGSGKSNVADRLAAHIDLEAVHLDEIHWLPGWIERSVEEETELLRTIIARDRWVIDGNYTPVRERFIDRTELYVWLDLPLRITFPRVLKRTLSRTLSRDLCCNGNRESLRMSFFTRDSILLWTLQMDRWRRRTLTEELNGLPHVRLRTPREIDRWLADACSIGCDASSAQR
jgi:adenylate kinase family enzyme